MNLPKEALKSLLPAKLRPVRVMILVLTGGLLFLSLGLYTLAKDTVTLYIDGRIIRVKTMAPTVRGVLQESGLWLKEGDEVTPSLEKKVTEGIEIKVERGVGLQILVDGESIPFRTPPLSVREVLSRAGVALQPEDKTSLPLEEKVWEGLRLKVTRVLSKQVLTKVQVKPPVEYVKDPHLEVGVKKVLQRGEAGLIEKEYTVIYEDGREVKRILRDQKTIKPVVKERVALGTKPRTLVVSRGRTIRYTKVQVMRASAYTPGPESCGIYADGYTATGKKAGYGVVAVDPRVIPLGTKLYIEGYGFAEAADVGSAIKGDRIDLCYETVREALLFGRRKVKVYILAP